jgi:exopolysaccharide biosynthesis polyprenyl glycosylphosphotransferase
MIWKPSTHNRLAQFSDFLTVLISLYGAYLVWEYIEVNYFTVMIGNVDLFTYRQALIAVLLSIISVYFFKINGAYSYQRFTSIFSELSIILKVITLNTLNLVFLFFLFRYGNVSRTYIAIAFIFMLVFLLIEKSFMFYIAKYIRERGYDNKNILMIGTGNRTIGFLETVEKNENWGLNIKGILSTENEKIGNIIKGNKVVGHCNDISKYLRELEIDDVIITLSLNNFPSIKHVIECCEREGTQVRLISDFFGNVAKRLRADTVYNIPIISISMTYDNELQLFVKRVIDIAGSLLGIILLSPLLVILAMLIKITSPGPAFYKWRVVGKNKKPFTGYKFRSMYINADEIKNELMMRNEMSGPVFKLTNDPRITPVGRFLRKYSLDELPQLFSVLKGDMSLVGPRPPLVTEFDEFDNWHRRKLSVKPGLTCLWQINGRSEITNFDEWAKLDLLYIDNWTLFLDLKILIKTIPAVLLGKGAK